MEALDLTKVQVYVEGTLNKTIDAATLVTMAAQMTADERMLAHKLIETARDFFSNVLPHFGTKPPSGGFVN